MAVALTQVITEDRASGAQVIDGSLKFDKNLNQYLKRTPGSAGNRRTWTISFWAKRVDLSTQFNTFMSVGTVDGDEDTVCFQDNELRYRYSAGSDLESTDKFRDIGWYHIVIAVDTTLSTSTDRIKYFVNGRGITSFSSSTQPSQNFEFRVNNNQEHAIGKFLRYAAGDYAGYMSQYYFIDGQQLDASYFGFTDPLTNTWRPKKYTGTYGTNGFYLPMDGNSPIGEDKSGRGNNWTPVNFSGSAAVDKATGALPILNTVSGGNVATVGVRTDAYASNLVLALPLVGNANDVSNQINSGSSTKTITNTGATATSTVSNFYGGSYDFDGTNDALTFTISGGLGSGDFTIEYWVYQDTLTDYQTHFSSTRGSTGFNVGTDGSGDFVWYDGNGGGSRKIEIIGAITTGRWYHWAFVRSGSTITGYLDGVAKSSYSSSINYSASAFSLGALDGSGEWTNGKFSDVRIYVGVAKYTSNFIPASTNPDILPDTPSGVAGGSALTKITDGAVYFDGTDDKLSIPSSDDLDLRSGDFTVEGFVYPLRSQEQSFVNVWNNTQFQVQMSSSGTLQASWAPYSISVYAITGSTPIRVNAWSHFAYTRSGSTFELFLDGISQGTLTSSNNASSTTDFLIGEDSSGGRDLQGYLSNIRVIKGTALYTANFTPPSAPLTNVTNTKLLCAQSNTSAGTAAVAPAIANNPNDGSIWSQVGTRSGTIIDWTSGFDGSRSTQTNNSSNTAAVITFDPVIPCSTATIWGNTGGNTAVIRINGTSVGGDGQNANPLKQLNTVDVSAQGGVQTISLQGTADGYAAKMGALICNPGAGEIDAVNGAKEIIPVGNAAATNFNPFTTDINAVRGQETGYPTLNPLNNTSCTLSEGNLKFVTAGNNSVIWATQPIPTSGKWYFESTFGGGDMAFMLDQKASRTPTDVNTTTTGIGMYMYYETGNTSNRFQTNSTNTSFNTSFTGDTVGDVYMFEVDMDNGTIRVRKQDGSNSGLFTMPAALRAAPLFPGFSVTTTWPAVTQTLNFGQKPFKFPPPEGFKTLCLANLPRPSKAAVRPDKYFNTVLYSGTSVTNRITGVGFQPDFVWVKKRSNSEQHELQDSVRGATKRLASNLTDAETTVAGSISSFDRDGFTVVDAGSTNESPNTYVAWCWKAGGSGGGLSFWKDDVGYASAAAAGLTAGTITPTGASVNTKSGFSILKYQGNGTSGANISHGLLEAPKLMIHKSLDQSRNWYTITTAVDGSPDYLYLNLTDQANNSSVTAPTSSLMYFTASAESNTLNENYIVYMWHDVPGLQKFGSYTGNGQNDPNCPFIYTGFKPSYLLTKCSSVGSAWLILDVARGQYYNPIGYKNATRESLYASGSAAESGTGIDFRVDFLSNGFKIRSTVANELNAPNETYIYAAFAEAPTQNLFGGQANAR